MIDFYRSVAKRDLPSGIPSHPAVESKVEVFQSGGVRQSQPTVFRLPGSPNANSNTNAIGPH